MVIFDGRPFCAPVEEVSRLSFAVDTDRDEFRIEGDD